MTMNLDMIDRVYAAFGSKVDAARALLGRPLTYAEKVLYTHAWESPAAPVTRG